VWEVREQRGIRGGPGARRGGRGPDTASPDCLLMVHLYTTAAAAALSVAAVLGSTQHPSPSTTAIHPFF